MTEHHAQQIRHILRLLWRREVSVDEAIEMIETDIGRVV